MAQEKGKAKPDRFRSPVKRKSKCTDRSTRGKDKKINSCLMILVTMKKNS